MSNAIHRAPPDARIVPLSELLSPRAHSEPAATVTPAAPPPPDPREVLEAERVRVLEEARAQGRAEGVRDAERDIEARAQAAERKWREALERNVEQHAAATRTLEAIAKAVPAAIDALEQQYQAIAVQVAWEATLRVVGRACEDHALVRGYCEDALAEYPMRPAVLKVHPAALAAITESVDAAHVRVEGDPRLAVGQCRLEGPKGLYDIQVGARLDALRRVLLDALTHAPREVRA